MCIERKRRLTGAIGLLFCLDGGWALGASATRGGPIDIAMEPLLAGATAAYKGSDGLYSIQSGSDTVTPIGPRFPISGTPVLSAQLTLLNKLPAAGWIEKLPEGNRLFAVSATPEGRYPTVARPLAEKSTATAITLEPLGDKLIVLDAAAGAKPALFVTQFNKDGSHAEREAVPMPDLEQLYSLTTVPAAPVLHLFLHGRSNGRDVIGMIDHDTAAHTTGHFEVVVETPVTPLVQGFAVRGAPAILFKVYKNERFSMNLAIREAQGWRISPVTGADGLDVARVDQQVWPDGRILLVYSAEQREKTKQRVYTALSGDLGASWRTRQLDSAEFDNTRAWLPRIAVADDRVAVVWEDARDIRSRIRMQLSMDRGNSWLARDRPISAAKYYAMRPRIDGSRDKLVVAWQQYRSDVRDQADLILQTLTWDEVRVHPHEKVLSADDKRRRLAAAVNGYWKAMEKSDQRAAYQAHDPFYRAKVSLPQHASYKGSLVYHRHTVEDLVIRGNEAVVTVVVTVSASKPQNSGTARNIPGAAHTVLDTWIFVDDHWYRKFVDSASGGSAINY